MNEAMPCNFAADMDFQHEFTTETPNCTSKRRNYPCTKRFWILNTKNSEFLAHLTPNNNGHATRQPLQSAHQWHGTSVHQRHAVRQAGTLNLSKNSTIYFQKLLLLMTSATKFEISIFSESAATCARSKQIKENSPEQRARRRGPTRCFPRRRPSPCRAETRTDSTRGSGTCCSRRCPARPPRRPRRSGNPAGRRCFRRSCRSLSRPWSSFRSLCQSFLREKRTVNEGKFISSFAKL